MSLNEHELGAIAVGGVIVFLLCFWAYMDMDDADKTNSLRYEGRYATAGISGASLDQIDTGDHYFHANYCHGNQCLVYLPHRYPVISGGNITALIHNGFSAMRRRAPEDAAWLENPPSGVMF